jgi:hypothetical protein
MELARAKQLRYDEHVTAIELLPNGDRIVRLQSDGVTPRRYRVTRVTTWKRDSNRIEVAVRYAMQHRTSVFTQNDLEYWYPTAEVEAMIEAGTIRAWPYRRGS